MVFGILILLTTNKKKKPEPAAASCVSIKRTVVKWIILQFNRNESRLNNKIVRVTKENENKLISQKKKKVRVTKKNEHKLISQRKWNVCHFSKPWASDIS